jgi:hypothetical protein
MHAYLALFARVYRDACSTKHKQLFLILAILDLPVWKLYYFFITKGKVIPLQATSGLWGSGRVRLQNF